MKSEVKGKTCTKCGITKSTDRFTRILRNTKAGRTTTFFSWCRDCVCAAHKTTFYREQNKLYKRRARAEGKVDSTGYSREYVKKYPEKVRARQLVTQAVKRGIIKKTPCVVCGRKDLVRAHHDDYSKPLVVRYLCPPHHYDAHRGSRVTPILSANKDQ